MSFNYMLLSKIQNNWKIDQNFNLQDIYKYKPDFEKEYPNNNHVEEKLRQVLQQLRDDGHIEFVDDKGNYKRLK